MPILDFKEIPAGNAADGTQDTFELLARDLLKNMGFKIVSEPNRGADGGKDILIIEDRAGIVGNTEIRWLVSCKHKAHSEKSVTPEDEQNIVDRLKQFKATGFMGFYSTLMSSGLSTRLDSLKREYCISIMDHESIESELLKKENIEIAKRYFPESTKKWILERREPISIFSKYEPLECEICHKDTLMTDGKLDPNGVVSFVNSMSYAKAQDYNKEKVLDIYVACKGRCDRTLENYWYKHDGTTGWADINDLSSPPEYLRWSMAILNELHVGNVIYEGESFGKLKIILLRIAQTIVRQPTEEEMERFKELLSIPIM